MELYGIRLIGITIENGYKLVLSVIAVGAIFVVRYILHSIAFFSGRHWDSALSSEPQSASATFEIVGVPPVRVAPPSPA